MSWISFILICLFIIWFNIFDIVDFLENRKKLKKDVENPKVEEQYWALKKWIENLGFDNEEKVIMVDVGGGIGKTKKIVLTHQFSKNDVLESGLRLQAKFPLFETVSQVTINERSKRGIKKNFTDCFKIQIEALNSETTILAKPKHGLTVLETVSQRNCIGFEMVITGEFCDSKQIIFVDDVLFEAFAKREIDTYFMDEYARHQSIVDDGSFSEEIRSNSEESLDIILKTILVKYKEVEIQKIKEEKDMAQSFNSAQQEALNIALDVYKKNRE